ncbi:30S ribosomal protein S19e [Nanoarchaeota archaeon]
MTEQATSLYDLEGGKYTTKLASKLKEMGEFEMPEWANYVKTSSTKERPPIDLNWWYARAASILRQIYLKGTLGVGRLSTKYGSKQNRGGKPSRFYSGGKKIIRTILQQSEKAGFLEKVTEGRHGRKLTKKGKQFLDEAAGEK